MFIVLTNAGAALVAASSGPITLTSFTLGSSYGYVPQVTDTNIHGSIIYQGVPSAPLVVNANLVKYGAYLDYDLGPFTFGEMGWYQGTTLVALAVAQAPITKTPFQAEGVGNTIKLEAFLSVVGNNYEMWQNISESDALFKYGVLGSVDQLPASVNASPNSYIISGVTAQQSAFLAYTDRTSLWNFDAYGYAYSRQATITGVASQSVTIALSDYSTAINPTYLGQVILEFSSGPNLGFCRNVQSMIVGGSSVTVTFASPLAQLPDVGDTCVFFLRQDASTKIPNLPIASHTLLGGVIIGNTLTVDSTGLLNVNPADYPVTSVNGQTGAVELLIADIPDAATVAKTNNYNDLSNKPTPYSLPIASTTVLGGVKAPSDGNLSIAGDGTIDLGFTPVKTVDNIAPDANGNINVPGAIGLVNPAAIANATDMNTLLTTGLFFVAAADAPSLLNGPGTAGTRLAGVVEIIPWTTTATGGDILQRWSDGTTVWYRKYTKTSATWSTWIQVISSGSLPIATTSVLGGVIVGSGLAVTPSGVLSVTAGYTLPIATPSTLGGVKVGTGLLINGTTGVLSADPSAAAQGVGAPNLVVNDSGQLGTANSPFTTSSSVLSIKNDAAGTYWRAAAQATSGTYSFLSPAFSVVDADGNTIKGAVQGEIRTDASAVGTYTINVLYYNGSNAIVATGALSTQPNNDGTWYHLVGTAIDTPPATAVTAKVQITAASATWTSLDWRRIKVENNTVNSLYSEEASVAYLTGLTPPSTSPVDWAGGAVGTLASNQVVMQYTAARSTTFPAGLGGSVGLAGTAATSATTFTIQTVIGSTVTAVGTVNWAAGATVPTFTMASALTLSAGQSLQVLANATADTTLANATFTLKGTGSWT